MDRAGEMMLPFKMTGTEVRPGEMVLFQTGFPSMKLEPPLDPRTPEKPAGPSPGQRP